MVTVHRAFGLRIAILTDDHEPAHVHVIGDGEMKVEIEGRDGLPRMVWSVGFKRNERRRIMDEVEANREYLLGKWIEIHGSIAK